MSEEEGIDDLVLYENLGKGHYNDDAYGPIHHSCCMRRGRQATGVSKDEVFVDEVARDKRDEDMRSRRTMRSEDELKTRRMSVVEEQGVDPKDQHQLGVRGGETEEGTKSLESCLQPQDGEVDGDRRGHSGDDW